MNEKLTIDEKEEVISIIKERSCGFAEAYKEVLKKN